MELSIEFNKTSTGVSFTFSETQLKQKNKLGKAGEVELNLALIKCQHLFIQNNTKCAKKKVWIITLSSEVCNTTAKKKQKNYST